MNENNLSHVSFAKACGYLVSFWFGAIEMKYDLRIRFKDKLSKVGWPFFKVVTLGEHNKREMLSEFRHGIGLIFYCGNGWGRVPPVEIFPHYP